MCYTAKIILLYGSQYHVQALHFHMIKFHFPFILLPISSHILLNWNL